MVVTRGEKGAVTINGDEVVECDIQKNLKIVDLQVQVTAGFLQVHQ